MVIEPEPAQVIQGEPNRVSAEEIIDVDSPQKSRSESRNDEEVQITAPPSQTEIRELTYQNLFKLKSMKLFNLTHNNSWRQLLELKDLYMAKIASNPEGTRVYIIGGARDSKSKHTVDSLIVYHMSADRITQQHLSCMDDPRASFGCLYVPRQNGAEIIVTGGYINGKLTSRCERYNVE